MRNAASLLESCRLFSPISATSDSNNFSLENNVCNRSSISDSLYDAKMLSFERPSHRLFEPYSQGGFEKPDSLSFENILPPLNAGGVAWSTPLFCTGNGFREGLEARRYDAKKAGVNADVPSQESDVCYTYAQPAAVTVCDGDQRQSFSEDFVTAGYGMKMEEIARSTGISVQSASTNHSSQWSNAVSFSAEGSAAVPSNINFRRRHGNEGEESPAAEQKRAISTLFDVDQASPSKKIRTSDASLKVRKESVGERVTALQQLVSPFGKTDTASVLLEAIGYIKFLQDQVRVLSTPYLKGFSSSQTQEGIAGESETSELRRRGLCVMPVAYTQLVANNNGADFWTSGVGGGTRL